MKRKKMLSVVMALVLTAVSGVLVYAAEADYGPLPDNGVIVFPDPSTGIFVFNGGAVSDNSSGNSNAQDKTVSEASDFNYTLEEFAALHLAEVNRIREEYGLTALSTDPILTEMAQARMDENNGYMIHYRPDGTMYWTIFNEYDTSLKANGENIAGAGGTPESIARGFLTTSHKENVLREDSTYIGIGVAWFDTIIGPRIAVLQLYARE